MISLLAVLLATVTSAYTPASYGCNGVTATFSVTFPYQAQTDLVVTSTTGAGAVTTLVSATDYTLSVTSTTTTATLTLNNPAVKCPNGNTLKITRTMALTQQTSFKAQLNFSPALHELVYDRLEMQIQQLDAKLVTANAPLTGNGTTGTPLGCATATGSVAGCLSSADWTTFNAKLTSVTADSPLLGAGTSGSHLTCQVAGSASAGCLSSADWTTFNNKSSNGVSLTSQNTWAATQTVAPSGSFPAGPGIAATGGTGANGEGGTFTPGGGGSPTTGAIRLIQQTAPSAPNDGALWMTTAGLFSRANGVTAGPFSAGTSKATFLFVNTASMTSGNTYYLSPTGGASTTTQPVDPPASTSLSSIMLMPISGTLGSIYCWTSNVALTTVTLKVWKNGSTVFTDSGWPGSTTSYNISAAAVSYSAGDRLWFSVSETAVTGVIGFTCSFQY